MRVRDYAGPLGVVAAGLVGFSLLCSISALAMNDLNNDHHTIGPLNIVDLAIANLRTAAALTQQAVTAFVPTPTVVRFDTVSLTPLPSDTPVVRVASTSRRQPTPTPTRRPRSTPTNTAKPVPTHTRTPIPTATHTHLPTATNTEPPPTPTPPPTATEPPPTDTPLPPPTDTVPPPTDTPLPPPTSTEPPATTAPIEVSNPSPTVLP